MKKIVELYRKIFDVFVVMYSQESLNKNLWMLVKSMLLHLNLLTDTLVDQPEPREDTLVGYIEC